MMAPPSLAYAILKRCADFLVALCGLLVLSPLLLPIAITIYLQDFNGPIFKQLRLGRFKRPFYMYKFRSMSVGTERAETGYYCFAGDSRITPFGRLLRRYSLDELPQLYNILLGNMSFVGPRPPVHDELDDEVLDDQDHVYLVQRFQLQPGLTGLAQISGRNDLGWKEKLYFDQLYFQKFSLLPFRTDLLILVATFRAVFASKGEFDSVPPNC
jgi:undecaprenyl phosphate N,N'-diacetylbacillosamine 1-phosphate transferase